MLYICYRINAKLVFHSSIPVDSVYNKLVMCLEASNCSTLEDIELALNYRGDDFIICVDLNTANRLLNDPVAADKYIEQLIAQEDKEPTNVENSNVESNNNSSAYIWTNKKPGRQDRTATEFFLSLRDKYRKYFDDKKTAKSQLWKIIALEMEEAGFKLGENGAERCRQKFSNLSKQYTNYVKHINTTGTERRDPPPYYTEMHNLLGLKHVTAPANLQDSQDFHQTAVDDEDATNDSTASTSASTSHISASGDSSSSAELIKNRFAALNKTIRPPSVNSQLMALLSKHHDEDTANKNKLFELIAVQNAQRDKMLDLIAQLVENTKKN